MPHKVVDTLPWLTIPWIEVY